MNELLARLWKLGKPLQSRFRWFMHAKFICGITGIVHADDGRERHEDTIARKFARKPASARGLPSTRRSIVMASA